MIDIASFLDAYRALIVELDANPFRLLPVSGMSGLDGWSAEARARLTPMLKTKDGSVVASLADPRDGAATIVWLDSEGAGPFALAGSLAEFVSVLPYGEWLYNIAMAVALYRQNPALYVDPAERFATAHAEHIVARAALTGGAPPVEPEDPDDESAWAAYMNARSAMYDGFPRALAWVEERSEVAKNPYEVVARAGAANADRMTWLAAQRTG